MSILEALTEANETIKVKGLSFASLQEFNAFHDSFNFLDYPRNVITPIVLDGNLLDNRVKEIIKIEGWMITRLNQDTNDFRSVKIEPDYINPMRILARKFIIALANTDATDPEAKSISYQIRSEYQWLSSHLFGVSYTMNWPVNRSIC